MKHTQGKQGQRAHSYPSGTGCIEIAVGHKTIIRIWDHPEAEANAERVFDFWNATDGMTTEEAVRYLEHGREMVEALATCYSSMLNENPTFLNRRWLRNVIKTLLAKLEGK